MIRRTSSSDAKLEIWRRYNEAVESAQRIHCQGMMKLDAMYQKALKDAKTVRDAALKPLGGKQ